MPNDTNIPRIDPDSLPTLEPDKTGILPNATAPGPAMNSHFSQNEKKRRRRRAPFIVLGVLFALLVIAYAGGIVAFSNVCYPNTTIADTDVSLMMRDTAAKRVKAAAESYKLQIEGNGFSWTYTPESSADIIDASAAVDNVLAANEPFIWPVKLYQALTGNTPSDSATSKQNASEGSTAAASDEAATAQDINLPDSFDREAFTADLDAALEAYNAERTGTFDSAGAFDTDAGQFTLEKARSNQKLDKTAVEDAALRAISTLTKKVTLDDASYIPMVEGATTEQLQTALDEANDLITVSLNLTMGGVSVATLDSSVLSQWITFDENLKPQLDTTPVTAWVHELATTKLDTAGSQRTYTRGDGKQITASGGTYGWISDEAALVTTLQEAVANKQSGDIEIPTKQTAATYSAFGAADWGAYCDVDLTEQHARYYDASGNLLWESGCISGNTTTGRGTPTGIYKLNSKGRDVTLVGADEDKDGEPDYKTPVSYWMPFVGGSVGLHDASWQASSSFSNPSAYTWTGSHGCVNLPPDKAAELYNIINVGDCVIVHW